MRVADDFGAIRARVEELNALADETGGVLADPELAYERLLLGVYEVRARAEMWNRSRIEGVVREFDAEGVKRRLAWELSKHRDWLPGPPKV